MPTLRTCIAIVIALGLGATAARADDADGEGSSSPPIEKGPFGLGLILGEPTGISVRLYVKDDQAIQGAVGSAFVSGGLQVHADYVWHPWIISARPDSFNLLGYVGPGVRFIQYDAGRGANDYVALGVRGVAGLVFDFTQVPLDAFVEVAGVGEYAFGDNHGVGLAINAGAGVRYYF